MGWAIAFTIFQVCWAIAWARIHLRIRKSRRYAEDRIQVDTNKRYKILSPMLYVLQNTLTIACFWFDGPWFLEFHNSNWIRSVGVAVMVAATSLYTLALKHLGENYSPCYDAHLPRHLVATGPYEFIRHPMYLAKLMVGVATCLISGSAWFLIPTLYLVAATFKSLANEEIYLKEQLPGYKDYQMITSKMIPKLC